MTRPCGCRSHSANDRLMLATSPALAAAVSNASASQIRQRLRHRRAIVVAAEQGQHAVAVMRKIGMDANPAAVAAAIDAVDRVHIFRRRLAVDAQIPLAAELDPASRMATLTRWRRPLRRRHNSAAAKRRGRDRGLRQRADREGGGEHRLGAGEFDGVKRRVGLPRCAPEIGKNCLRNAVRSCCCTPLDLGRPAWLRLDPFPAVAGQPLLRQEAALVVHLARALHPIAEIDVRQAHAAARARCGRGS